jgi:monoterpene epsilon-lactone hydrolase
MEKKHLIRIALLVLLAAGWVANAGAQPATAPAAGAPQPLRDFVPATISPQAQAIYRQLLPMVEAIRKTQKVPQTVAEFDARYAETIARAEPGAEAMVKAMGVTDTYTHMNGVGVLETKPPNYKDDGTVLIDVHGGGWVLDSARTSAGGDAMMSMITGKRILSVDYTVAPHGNWKIVTDQVVAVYKAVLAEGYDAGSIGMFGGSAGGDIVPASVLKMRDQGLPLPGALVLMSPCVDLHMNGDTETTLADADPALSNREDIVAGIKVYADSADWSNPYVSPIYGDFTKPFPPVLLQAGTKEIVLSDSVRLYQALKTNGHEAELDVYEGMAHGFQAYMAGTPEQKAAYAEVLRFWSSHLKPTKR